MFYRLLMHFCVSDVYDMEYTRVYTMSITRSMYKVCYLSDNKMYIFMAKIHFWKYVSSIANQKYINYFFLSPIFCIIEGPESYESTSIFILKKCNCFLMKWYHVSDQHIWNIQYVFPLNHIFDIMCEFALSAQILHSTSQIIFQMYVRNIFNIMNIYYIFCQTSF